MVKMLSEGTQPGIEQNRREELMRVIPKREFRDSTMLQRLEKSS
jgi:hypothetical protein